MGDKELRGWLQALDDKISINCTKLDNLKEHVTGEVGKLQDEVAAYAEMTQAAGENVVAQDERFEKLKDHVTSEIAGVNEKLDILLKE